MNITQAYRAVLKGLLATGKDAGAAAKRYIHDPKTLYRVRSNQVSPEDIPMVAGSAAADSLAAAQDLLTFRQLQGSGKLPGLRSALLESKPYLANLNEIKPITTELVDQYPGYALAPRGAGNPDTGTYLMDGYNLANHPKDLLEGIMASSGQVNFSHASNLADRKALILKKHLLGMELVR
jgi:hypothetical protein